jgi:hypothetical protein
MYVFKLFNPLYFLMSLSFSSKHTTALVCAFLGNFFLKMVTVPTFFTESQIKEGLQPMGAMFISLQLPPPPV